MSERCERMSEQTSMWPDTLCVYSLTISLTVCRSIFLATDHSCFGRAWTLDEMNAVWGVPSMKELSRFEE